MEALPRRFARSPIVVLLAAVYAIERGSRREALQLVDHTRVSGELEVARACLLIALGAFPRALSELEGQRSPEAQRLRLRLAGELGWTDHCASAALRLVELEPHSATWRLTAAGFAADDRRAEAAASLLHPLTSASEPDVLLRGAELLLDLGCPRAATPLLQRLVDAALQTTHRTAAAKLALRSGDFDLAEALFDSDPAELARLRLWQGDVSTAEALLGQAPAGDTASLVRGALLVLQGSPQAALRPLRAVHTTESANWQTEAHLALGDLASAEATLGSSATGSQGNWIRGLLEARLRLLQAERGDPATHLARKWARELSAAFDALQATPTCVDDTASLLNAIEEALRQLGGNRSEYPTRVHGDGLSRLEVPPLAADQLLLAAAHPERGHPRATHAALDAALELDLSRDNRAWGLATRAQLRLWVGQLDAALADAEASLALSHSLQPARHAWLVATLLRGDPATAKDTAERWRDPELALPYAEACLRLGEQTLARGALAHARSTWPRCPSVWLFSLLAAEASEDESTEPLRALLAAGAPGWMAAARGSAERARELLAGNRSLTTPTMLGDEGFLRPLTWRQSPLDVGEYLRRAETALLRAGEFSQAPMTALNPPDPERLAANIELAASEGAAFAPAKPHAPRELSADQLEHFRRHGYLVVEHCFSDDTAQRWIDDANDRLRRAPERYVRPSSGDPNPDVRGYDPTEPRTWTFERLEVLGDRTVPITELSPRAWHVICDLLGGPERVATREWGNQVKPNFPRRHSSDIEPTSSSWHLDYPSRNTRLDEFSLGLICIVMLSEVLPGGGGTMLAPESVSHVAQELAANPAGVDFVRRDAGPRITRRCRRFVELTGKPGDIAFIHPLMLHTGSPNSCSRVRWMGNPLVELAEPLRVDRPDPRYYSPVEQVVVDALG